MEFTKYSNRAYYLNFLEYCILRDNEGMTGENAVRDFAVIK